MKGWVCGLAGLFLVLVMFTGCEQVFTFNIGTWLQRDPEDMSLTDKLDYARHALASGNKTYMEKAYHALASETLTKDADITLQCELAMEICGVTGIFADILTGDIDITQNLATISTLINDFLGSMTQAEIDQAATAYSNADAMGVVFSGTDYLMGSLCILFSDANGDISNVTQVQARALADGFVTSGLNNLPAGDPALDILNDLFTFLYDPINFP